MDVVRAIRFPRDSEHVAVYSPREQRLCLEHMAAGERSRTPADAIRRELELVHAIKSTFDAELVA